MCKMSNVRKWKRYTERRKRKPPGRPVIAMLLALVAALLFASIVVAAPSGHSVDWWVMGGGSGSGSAGSSSLDGTFGQAVVGVEGSGEYVICAGFWYGLGPCGDPPRVTVYLPIVLRNGP
jgi:hypothetical protein